MSTRQNEQLLPGIGYGTYGLSGTDATAEAVRAAIDAGYRLIDTAANYGNEAGVGEGVRTSTVPRSEVIVSSKVWPSDLGYDATLRAFEQSLATSGLDYLDLYLIHWPCSEEENAASWRALERLKQEGVVRMIGVSNFTVSHLEALLATANERPVVNQIEFHPRHYDSSIVDYCRDHTILIEAWSPLAQGVLFPAEPLVRVAAELGRSPAQVLLRWSVEQGAIPIPKSRSPQRMAENISIFDFALSDEQMNALEVLRTGERLGPDPASHHFCA